jgi:hypothetical protein
MGDDGLERMYQQQQVVEGKISMTGNIIYYKSTILVDKYIILFCFQKNILS